MLGGKPQGHVYTGATGVGGEPSDVNPLTTFDPLALGLVLAFTHESLLDRDPATGELRPALAEKYEVSADGTTCTFTVRAGVVFSDGSPLTMDDVLFGWELAQAKQVQLGQVGSGFALIAKVESLDARRFRVHFKDQYYAAAAAVGLSWIVAKKQFFLDRVRSLLLPDEAMPAVASERFAGLLKQIKDECGPGTGPYELLNEPNGRSNWHRRQELLLTRHEGCWQRNLRPGTWNFAGIRTLFRDPLNALLRGEVDWFSSPQLDQLLASHPELKTSYTKYVYDRSDLGCYRIIWNCQQKPFDDPRVRRAMGMLVNPIEVAKVFGDAAKPATAHAKLGSRAYPEIEPLPFDPKAARQLLREAGFGHDGKPDGGGDTTLSVKLLTYQGNDAIRRILDLFVGAAQLAGVKVVFDVRDSAGVVAEKSAGEWHGLLALQYFDTWGDPFRFLNSAGLENEGKWHNAEADRLSEAARHEMDPERRAALWRELHQLAYREQPATLIAHPMASMLFSVHIQDCLPGPLGLKVDKAWVLPEHQRK